MSYQRVKDFFENNGLGDRVRQLPSSSATVELAAQAVGCKVSQIAKTLSFLVGGKPILIVAAGNVRIDNQKYKAKFAEKPKMIPIERLQEYIGHTIGGICPFVIKQGVTVYLDNSLKANATIYPAAGSANSVAHLSITELERLSAYKMWVDVTREQSPKANLA